MSAERWALAALMLAACQGAEPETAREDAAPEIRYLGVQTRLLDAGLVNVLVELRQGRDAADAEDYARCAVAGYTRIRGYAYARHVRTNVAEEGGLWRADAVYTISPTLPEGSQRIDARDAVASCRTRGIPTV